MEGKWVASAATSSPKSPKVFCLEQLTPNHNHIITSPNLEKSMLVVGEVKGKAEDHIHSYEPTFVVPRGLYQKHIHDTTAEVEKRKGGWESSKMKEIRNFGPFAMFRKLKLEDDQVMLAFKKAIPESTSVDGNGIDARGLEIYESLASSALIEKCIWPDVMPTRKKDFNWKHSAYLMNLDNAKFRENAPWSADEIKVNSPYYTMLLNLIVGYITNGQIIEYAEKRYPNFARVRILLIEGNEL